MIARLCNIAKWPKVQMFTKQAAAKLHHCPNAQNCKMAQIANIHLASICKFASLPDCAILQNGTSCKCSQSQLLLNRMTILFFCMTAHFQYCLIAQNCKMAQIANVHKASICRTASLPDRAILQNGTDCKCLKRTRSKYLLNRKTLRLGSLLDLYTSRLSSEPTDFVLSLEDFLSDIRSFGTSRAASVASSKRSWHF